VLTIHDLQYRTFPEYFTPLKRRYLDAMIPRLGDAARRLVTVPSEYVRHSVIRELDIDGRARGGGPARVRTRTARRAHRRGRDLRGPGFGLGDGRVLVFPAMTAPHKNHVLPGGADGDRVCVGARTCGWC
jgi:hypothetical protein